jgi:hypothetical protein
MSQGFKGKELGIEIKRLEVEKFKQMIWFTILHILKIQPV